MKKNEFGGFISNSTIHLLLIVLGIAQIAPMFWLLYSSFKPSAAISKNVLAFPKFLYLENYNLAYLDSQYNIKILTYLKNSIIVTAISLLLLTIISILAAYALAKIRFPGKNILILILIVIMGIPGNSLIIPLFYFMAKMHLINNYFGLILPYAAFFAPWSILMLQTYFRQVPNEIIEAAKIDGCSEFRTFWSVVLPLSKGAVASISIFNSIWIWNEFLFSLVIMKNNNYKTLPVGLTGLVMGRNATDWGPLFASLIIAIIPAVIIFFIFNKNIIKGVGAGAIKG